MSDGFWKNKTIGPRIVAGALGAFLFLGVTVTDNFWVAVTFGILGAGAIGSGLFLSNRAWLAVISAVSPYA